jgi:protein phosphatase
VSDPPVRGVRVAAGTLRNARPRNEDAIAIGGWLLLTDAGGSLELSLPVDPEHCALIAVADGLGGRPDGDLAARIAAQRLTGGCRAGPCGPEELAAAFRDAEAAVIAGGGDRAMGCAAAAVAVGHDGRCAVANVGDVRVYRLVDGYPGLLTVDDRPQTPSGPSATWVVTDHLGAPRRGELRPHLYEFRARPDDRLILCTDGLHDVVTVAAMRRLAQAAAGPAVEALIRAALELGASDNVTVVVVDVAP